MRPVIPTVLWGRVRVPSGPLESISKQIKSLQIVEFAGFFVFVLCQKCIRDLAEFGYIDYQPSYNPMSNSLVYLLMV